MSKLIAVSVCFKGWFANSRFRLLIGLVLVRGVWTVVKDPWYPLLAGERVRIGLLGQRSWFGP